MKRLVLAVCVVLLGSSAFGLAQAQPWPDVLAKAKGQTMFWNAWGGDDKTNAFIAWVGDEVEKRYGITIRHVRLRDTAEAVTRVVAEKAAGRNQGGSVDLIWINGPNFLAMKEQGLLFGPFTGLLPNYHFVDTETKPSNLVDFTVPVDGLESPWRMAQIVFIHDSARTKDMPRSIPALLDWARRNPGRLTHPSVGNFLGATFLKQALYELTPDPAMLQKPATDENFDRATAPLWVWYDQLLPWLWRQGRQFPETGPAQRQLLNDGDIDILISFNPPEAAVSIAGGLLPNTARTFVMDRGTIGNTSFVAIPYNAANKEAAMVVADFLLDPIAQAKAQDPAVLGNVTVLDLRKLTAEQRSLFETLPRGASTPTPAELGRVLLEPHASWMTRIAAEWTKRYTR
ncbi:MAG: ABC transporter substrate-binding protein [Rhodospirillaceae bacterium]|nr:ABC transporter substrate-binding protein [Rhodospirillaceae bacterium]